MAFIGIVYYCVKRKLDKEKEIKKKTNIVRIFNDFILNILCELNI